MVAVLVMCICNRAAGAQHVYNSPVSGGSERVYDMTWQKAACTQVVGGQCKY